MVTPFSASGDLDIEAAKELSQWLVETGSEGLVVGGTTGESPTLSDSELMALSRSAGVWPPGVPTFVFGQAMMIGFDDAGHRGRELLALTTFRCAPDARSSCPR